MADPEELFATHQRGLFKYFCRCVGQADAARDLLQEVFLRVSRAGHPQEPSNSAGWVFRIARNVVLDHQRHRRRHPEPVALVDEGSRPASQDVNLAVSVALDALARVS